MAGLGEKLSRHAQGLGALAGKPTATESPSSVVMEAQPAHLDLSFTRNAPPKLTEISLTQIEPDPNQPRRDLGDVTDLAASIRELGLVQPIIVFVVGYERYRILAGERRFTAAGKAGLKKVPAIVRSVEEHQRLELQLVENLHRKDLNPFEEAESYKRLLTEFSLSHEELGRRLGKTQVSITEALQVLNLPTQIQQEAAAIAGTGGKPITKSLLLEIARRPRSDQPRLWDAAKRGDLTVKKARAEREGRKQAATKKQSKGLRKPLRYPIALTQNRASVTVELFDGPVRLEDVVASLEEALEIERQRITK